MKKTERNKNTLCSIPGCNKTVHLINNNKQTGKSHYRHVCFYHHIEKLAKKNNLTITQFNYQFHPARKFKKNYCENNDGRLGFICTTTIVHDSMLDVDHCDGNPSNNNESNLQTLCKSCHGFKTFIRGDHKSQGRKTLKRNPKNA